MKVKMEKRFVYKKTASHKSNAVSLVAGGSTNAKLSWPERVEDFPDVILIESVEIFYQYIQKVKESK